MYLSKHTEVRTTRFRSGTCVVQMSYEIRYAAQTLVHDPSRRFRCKEGHCQIMYREVHACAKILHAHAICMLKDACMYILTIHFSTKRGSQHKKKMLTAHREVGTWLFDMVAS